MEFTDSALRHVPEDDIWHAMNDTAAIDRQLRRGDPPVNLTVGRDRTGRWLEVLWVPLDRDDLVFHAMAIGNKFRHLIPKGYRR